MAPGINSLLKIRLLKLIMCAPHIWVLAVLMVLQIPQISEHNPTCCTDVAPRSYPLSTQLHHRLSCSHIISWGPTFQRCAAKTSCSSSDKLNAIWRIMFSGMWQCTFWYSYLSTKPSKSMPCKSHILVRPINSKIQERCRPIITSKSL